MEIAIGKVEQLTSKGQRISLAEARLMAFENLAKTEVAIQKERARDAQHLGLMSEDQQPPIVWQNTFPTQDGYYWFWGGKITGNHGDEPYLV